MDVTAANSNGSDVIKEVRWRYRIYRYLQFVASFWVVAGVLGSSFATAARLRVAFLNVVLLGLGIMTVAWAVCLATYRCPACDRRLNARKDVCPGCGITIR